MRALAWILPLLCRVAWAQDPGCVLTGGGENLPPGEIQAQGVGFGTVKDFTYHHEVTLWIPQGPWSQRTSVLMDTGHARIAVEFMPTRPSTVYLRKPVRFGVFTAAAAQPVRVLNRAGGTLTLQATASAIFTPRDALTAQAPCAAVSLPLEWTSSSDELKEPSGARVLIETGTEFPILASPSGPVAGTITLVEPDDAVVLDRRDDQLHVHWAVDDGALEGWIPIDVTTPAEGGYGRGVGSLRVKQDFEDDVLDDTTTRCVQNVALSVRVGRQIAGLGQLKSGVPFRVKHQDASGTVVALELDGISLHPDAELLLTPTAWRDCRQAR